MMKTTRTSAPSALLLFAMLAGGCTTSPTQIIVTVEGDAAVAEVAIEVAGVEEARTAVPTAAGDGLPLTLTLVHGEGGLGPFTVAAIGFDGAGAEAARDCASTTFRNEATVEVTLTLSSGTFTDCDAIVPDAGTPVDGGATDAGVACDPVACAMTDPAAACVDGRCALTNCGGNSDDCDEMVAGCETNTNNSEDHCGGCFMPCAAGETCNGGNCPRP